MRGGNINSNSQQLWYAGQEGRYWSSRADSSSSFAYSLTFDSSYVSPSSNYYVSRYYGRSLRCLIPTT